MPRRSGSTELDIAAVALLVTAVTVYLGGRRLRHQAEDLGTADRQLRRLGEHNREQAQTIDRLEGERPTEMFESMRREMGEVLLELDGPAGADVDLRRGAPGMPNPALRPDDPDLTEWITITEPEGPESE